MGAFIRGAWRLSWQEMRATTVVVLLALALLGTFANASNETCTDVQNETKTTTAHAVLACAKLHCDIPKSEQNHCLCTYCAQEAGVADESSCACGLSDRYSAAA